MMGGYLVSRARIFKISRDWTYFLVKAGRLGRSCVEMFSGYWVGHRCTELWSFIVLVRPGGDVVCIVGCFGLFGTGCYHSWVEGWCGAVLGEWWVFVCGCGGSCHPAAPWRSKVADRAGGQVIQLVREQEGILRVGTVRCGVLGWQRGMG